MPLVYRAETKEPDGSGECVGPFNSDACWDIAAALRGYRRDGRDYFSHARYPGSCADLVYYDRRYHIGCTSLHQWRTWFPKPVAKVLRDQNYVLRVFDVPEDALVKGRRQVAFDPAKARLVETLDPLTKLPLAA